MDFWTVMASGLIAAAVSIVVSLVQRRDNREARRLQREQSEHALKEQQRQFDANLAAQAKQHEEALALEREKFGAPALAAERQRKQTFLDQVRQTVLAGYTAPIRRVGQEALSYVWTGNLPVLLQDLSGSKDAVSNQRLRAEVMTEISEIETIEGL